MIRLLLVGYGNFGRVYAKRVREHPAYDLVGVVEASAGPAAQALHDEHRVYWAQPGSGRVPHADIVLVATSEQQHAPVALNALEDGAHVLLAKPGALGVVDAERIRAAARVKRRSVYVDWTPLSSTAWDATFAQTLRLGPVSTIRMTRRGSSTPRSCGPIWDLCPHDVAIAWRITGGTDPVTHVTSTTWGSGAFLGLTHASGCVTRIEADYAAAERERRIDITCRDGIVSWLQDTDTVQTITDGTVANVPVEAGADAITRRLTDIANTLDHPADDADQFVDVIRVLESAVTHATPERVLRATEPRRAA